MWFIWVLTSNKCFFFSLIFVSKDNTWRKREANQKEPKRKIKRKIRTEMRMAKETWIPGQCQEVVACLRKNNSKKAYQLVMDLTKEKQGKSTTYKTGRGSVSQRKVKSLTGGQSIAQTFQLWDWGGPNSTWLPTDTRWRASAYSMRRGGSSSQSAKDRKVSGRG